MGSVLGFKYFFTFHHLFESFFALLIEFYELAHARRMTHFQAFGNPFVAHSAVLFHHRCQQCFLPGSFALLCERFSIYVAFDFRS